MPPTEPLTELSVRDAADAIRRRTITSVALVEACLARVRELDRRCRRGRTSMPRARWPRPARATPSPPPAASADLFTACRWGSRTSSTSRACRRRRARGRSRTPRPTRDATVVARLRAAGAVIVGKTHTTQFAYRDPAPTRNPWNHEHTPGGSSSGSAAAVATRMVPCALGIADGRLDPASGRVLRRGRPQGPARCSCRSTASCRWGGRSTTSARSRARWPTPRSSSASWRDARSSRPPCRRRDWRSARQLFDRADAGLRQHLDAVVTRLAGAGAQVSEVTLPPAFAEIHAAGQVVLESEAAAYHQNISPSTPPTTGLAFAAMMPIGLNARRSNTSSPIARASRSATR